MSPPDTALQAQVDAQLLEQGAFCALELLLNSGRLMYEDYEAWRRGQIETLDSALMGDHQKIRAELTRAAQYARSIGLIEEPREFLAWSSEAQNAGSRALRISEDSALRRLIASRHLPAQDLPQLDLFFDNPVVALTAGIVKALCARNVTDARRQLDRLYVQAPNHADLAAFDALIAALTHLGRPIEDVEGELDFLRATHPLAKRLLGAQARDLLVPLWRQLAVALTAQPFVPQRPDLHSSHAFAQAQDWGGVSESVLRNPGWQQHAPLCLRLAESGFYRQRSAEALTGWCQLCWHDPTSATRALERYQPDTAVTESWQRFLDATEEVASELPRRQAELTASDFPAWLLLDQPGLAQLLSESLPVGASVSEEAYRRVHRWAQARRNGQNTEEMSLRKTLQANHPGLFALLKQAVAREGRAAR